MPDWVIAKLGEALNELSKPLKGSRILVLGVAYKKNVDDIRESPSLKLIELLGQSGSVVSYADPYVPRIPRTRSYRLEMTSLPLTPENLADQDAVLLATDHDEFDYDMISANSQLIIDTRGRYPAGTANVVKA